MFLDEVYELVRVGRARKALTRIFDEFDDRISQRDYGSCDMILRAMDVSKLDTTTALGVLAITLQARECLMARDSFVKLVEQELQKSDPDRMERLMGGLR